MKLSAVILAGGKNSRMEGLDKAFLLIEGQPLIEKLINILRAIFDEIVIATNSPGKYLGNPALSDVIITTDHIKNIGPLGGIYTGLKTIKNDAAFFVACDMPYIDKDIICKQINSFQNQEIDCLVSRCGSKVHPLHGIYSKSVLDIIPEVIKSNNFSIMNLVDRCKNVPMDFDLRYEECFTNVNWASDVKKTLTQPVR